MKIDRRTFIGTGSAASIVLAVSPFAIPPVLSRPLVRYRFATAGGPPCRWNALKIVDKATGGKIPMVIDANADEGWYRSYIHDDHGKPIFDGDGYAIKRVEADIEISLDEDQGLSPDAYVQLISDVEAGVIYDEDLTDETRSWLDNGKPCCPQCGRVPMPFPDKLCMGCYAGWVVDAGKA